MDIETILKVFNFLDITFNLNNGTYKHLYKPNNPLLYIKKSSNDPLHIINQLSIVISDRWSTKLSNKDVFNASKGE